MRSADKVRSSYGRGEEKEGKSGTEKPRGKKVDAFPALVTNNCRCEKKDLQRFTGEKPKSGIGQFVIKKKEGDALKHREPTAKTLA